MHCTKARRDVDVRPTCVTLVALLEEGTNTSVIGDVLRCSPEADLVSNGVMSDERCPGT